MKYLKVLVLLSVIFIIGCKSIIEQDVIEPVTKEKVSMSNNADVCYADVVKDIAFDVQLKGMYVYLDAKHTTKLSKWLEETYGIFASAHSDCVYIPKTPRILDDGFIKMQTAITKVVNEWIKIN